MAAKWADAALQVVAFDEAAEGEAGASSPAFVAYAVHAFSLLHATALHSLRGDSMEGALVPLHPGAQVGWLYPHHKLAGYPQAPSCPCPSYHWSLRCAAPPPTVSP